MICARKHWLAASAVSVCLHAALFVALGRSHETESLAQAAGSRMAIGIVSTASAFQDGEIETEALETENALESEGVEARQIHPSLTKEREARPIDAPVAKSPPEANFEASATQRQIRAVSDAAGAEATQSPTVIEAVDVEARRHDPREVATDPEAGVGEPAVLEATTRDDVVDGRTALREVAPVARTRQVAATDIAVKARSDAPGASPPRRKENAKRAKPSTPSRASQAGGGASGQNRTVSGRGAMTSYLGLVSARLHRQKRYPAHARRRRMEGTAVISFAIDSGGRVVRSRLARSSGHDLLDREVLAMLDRAKPFPPIPAEVGRRSLSLSVPVAFSVR
jgi:protein TonB